MSAATPPGSLPAGPFVVGCHATSRDDKLWPEAHWRALIAAFARAGFTVLLPWGSDAERARSERLAAGEVAAKVPPRLSLPALAGVLARAELVVGVDTGLVHLAAALGTPTVALFVATDPTLAGIANTTPRGCDLGGVGVTPSPDAVQDAAGALMRAAPRC